MQPEQPSKTQRKKDMLALQKLGETLIGLSATQLAKIPLPATLLEAIHFARTMKSHGAKRRQLQYIGKLMRDIDAEPIQKALKKMQMSHQEIMSQFHQIEAWRDQLIAEGDTALQKFLAIYPEADRKNLRLLIGKAKHQLTLNKKIGAELFNYLQHIMNHH